MKGVRRISNTNAETFVREFIAEGQPVIVTDAMERWPAMEKWTPDFFSRSFGHYSAQIYDNLFTLRSVVPLREYIEDNMGTRSKCAGELYVRWYAKFKSVEFDWSDAVFDAIATDWGSPYFLPTSGFVMPLCRPPDEVKAHLSTFPYKGLFISCRGARTRLHRDPYGTDAVLCQFYGSKKVVLYDPRDQPKVMNGTQFVDPRRPDLKRFPSWPEVTPVMEDILRPGEIMFTPSGWFHDVLSMTDSISITWNFVHAAKKELFLVELTNPANEKFDRAMLEFFFGSALQERPSTAEISRLAASVLWP